jgi:hypothetical protein
MERKNIDGGGFMAKLKFIIILVIVSVCLFWVSQGEVNSANSRLLAVKTDNVNVHQERLKKLETDIRERRNATRTDMSRRVHRTGQGASHVFGIVFAVAFVLIGLASLLKNYKPMGLQMAVLNAVQTGKTEELEALLAKGVDVNEKGFLSRSALPQAAMGGKKNVVELLIDRGARINEIDTEGNAPLHYAVTGGYDDIVELLIKKGADVNAKNRAGKTPLSLAIKKNKFKAEVLLRQYGGRE